MKIQLHKAKSRGYADHGWLKSYHSFSFANYYNPQRMHFGALRVLNDDYVEGGMGFGAHPHRDMEIISIPLSGDLEHQDSMDTRAVIRRGEIQVMSAGRGVRHSEFNKNPDIPVEFLQIWIVPDTLGVEPRYAQMPMEFEEKTDQFHLIIAPKSEGKGLWIHQNAWFSIGKFTVESEQHFAINRSGNGVFLFVLEGGVQVEGHQLDRRDAIAIEQAQQFTMTIAAGTTLLLMEVPMLEL